METNASLIPIAGAIPAGFASPEEEELRDIISFDEYILPHPHTSFVLTVSGQAMTGAGIHPGDLAIIEKGGTPKNGDIVLAEVDGQWVLRHFTRKGRAIVLEAANAQHPSLLPQNELRIGGVLTAVVREYHL